MSQLALSTSNLSACESRSDSASPPGKRLLSIDAEFSERAGVLPALKILEEIVDNGMQNIMLRPEHQVEPLVPCEHFDLIGGSGHGGFIALMFGSLRLPVRTALDEYTIIHRFLSIEALDMAPELKSEKLKELLRDLIHRHSDNSNLFIELVGPPIGCNAFAVVAQEDSQDPRCWGNYPQRSAKRPPSNTRLLDIFLLMLTEDQSFVTGKSSSKFQRAAAPLNPAQLVAKEAHRIWPEGRISCLVSVGSGHHNEEPSSESASERQRVHDELNARINDPERLNSFYYRVNVETGGYHDLMYRDMANPPMTYETVLDTVFTGTKNYLAGLPYLCETIRDKLTIQPTQDNALHNYCVTTSELAGVHSNSDIGIESEDQSPSLHSSINSRFNLVNHDPVPMVEWRKSYLNWIYETSHYGYPLADPCDKFCKKPIEIGDVGYIDDLGHFHFLFNATRPAEEQRVYKLPKPFKHFNVERVLRADSNVGNFLNLKTGGMLDFKASGSIPLQTFTEEAKFEIEFIPRTIGGRRSSNSSSIGSAKPMSEELGVILILGDNFYTVELEDDPKLRKYVAKHSRSWYLHFKGQDDHNLILVTSVNLQATWGRAAFSSNLPKGAAIFAGQVHESPGGQNSLRGLWVESPFPTPSIIFEGDRNFPVQHALRLRKDDVVGREEFTQALFIEGYRIRKRGEMERLDSSGPTPRPDRTLDKLLDVGVKVKHFFTSPFSTKSKVVSGQPGV